MRLNLSFAAIIVASALLVGVIVASLHYFGLDEEARKLLSWLESKGPIAMVAFVMIMVAVVLLLLPGVFFTIAAGFVYGVLPGTLLVVTGTTIGASIAFLVARHFAGPRAAAYILKNPRIHLLDREISLSGWQVVMLTRMIPFFPFKLSNYFFGLTSISFRDYFIGTLIGIIPLSLHSVFLGSIAADLTSTTGIAQPVSLTVRLAGLAIIVFSVIYFGRIAVRTLKGSGVPIDRSPQ